MSIKCGRFQRSYSPYNQAVFGRRVISSPCGSVTTMERQAFRSTSPAPRSLSCLPTTTKLQKHLQNTSLNVDTAFSVRLCSFLLECSSSKYGWTPFTSFLESRSFLRDRARRLKRTGSCETKSAPPPLLPHFLAGRVQKQAVHILDALDR